MLAGTCSNPSSKHLTHTGRKMAIINVHVVINCSVNGASRIVQYTAEPLPWALLVWRKPVRGGALWSLSIRELLVPNT